MPHVPNVFDFIERFAPQNVATIILNLILVLGLTLYMYASLRRSDSLVPGERLTLRNFFELLLEGLVNQMRETIGPDWARYAPLVGTLALFILLSNLLGLVPFLTGPTSYVETNLAWAILSFITYNIAGVQKHGLAYYKHLLGPVWWLAPIMLPVEIISNLSRLLSLTVRLTANMFADHTLVAIFLAFPVIGYFVPWMMLGLGLFVAFLQAFIFAYLTMAYIGQALAEDH
jgi:F-type H+-transporting ATPase subunit a